MNKQGITTLIFTVALTFVVLALVLVSTSGLAQESPFWAEKAPLAPLGTAFTYQGQLKNNGQPVTVECSLAFRLYDAATEGASVGSPITRTEPITDGLFTVALDFGADVFTGDARWLGIRVQCPGDANYIDLVRQPITAAPYALYALGAPWEGLRGAPAGFADGIDDVSVIVSGTQVYAGEGLVRLASADAVTLSLALPYRLPQTCANGQIAEWNGVAWVCGDDDVGAGGAYWSLSGNAGTNPLANFLGTTDAVSLTLAVNGATALRLEPTGGTPNLLGGYDGNGVPASVVGAVIGGGGNSGNPNRVTGNYGTVGGGNGNTADSTQATVAGGASNYAGYRAAVGGGLSNTALGKYAAIGGGYDNCASGEGSTIAGGAWNIAAHGVEGYTTVGGGIENQTTGSFATVGGGLNNTASGEGSTIAGGAGNVATQGSYGLTTVGGGLENQATGSYATVVGGKSNEASGYYATVAGGFLNKAGGEASFAAGYHAQAEYHGTFVWADDHSYAFASTTANEFSARSTGGVRFVLGIDGVGNPTWTCSVINGSSWSCSSDRDLKANMVYVDGTETLERLSQVPIFTWNAKGQDPLIRHIGPMAQDFYAAFEVGEDDRHIATIDLDGVALAAIQGLYTISQEQDTRVAALEAEVFELRAEIQSLQNLTGVQQEQMEDLATRLATLEIALTQSSTPQKISKDGFLAESGVILAGVGLLGMALRDSIRKRRVRNV